MGSKAVMGVAAVFREAEASRGVAKVTPLWIVYSAIIDEILSVKGAKRSGFSPTLALYLLPIKTDERGKRKKENGLIKKAVKYSSKVR